METVLEKICQLRKELHSAPELSGKEVETAQRIKSFLRSSNPTSIVESIGGEGIAFVYNSGKEGPTILLRADMDAVPITEANSFEHRSKVDGIAHLCGHDGHTAILAGVGLTLDKSCLQKGKLVLLFQPAEETGEGAAAVIAHKKFESIKPNYAFALHNLPGYPLGTFVVREGSFASASTGIIVKLKGFSSHAAHPEDGNNPDRAMAQMILELNALNEKKELFESFVLITVIHAQLGNVAFGTTPGDATLMATLRTYENSDMDELQRQVERIADSICSRYALNHSVRYVESFPATVNHGEAVAILTEELNELEFDYQNLSQPFRWSEDFGHFAQVCPSALFGVGSGLDHPQLHSEVYDFPHAVIAPSVELFQALIKKFLGENKQ